MEITYSMTRRDAWRCNLDILSRQPMLLFSSLCATALVTWGIYWQYPFLQSSLHLHSARWWWLPLVFLCIFCAILFQLIVAFQLKIIVNYPDTESRPVNVTVLTPQCLHDANRKVTRGKVVLMPVDIPWTDIKSICWHQGDIYFRRKNGCSLVPHTAFDNPRQGQVFYDTATAYWRNAKSGLLVTPDSESWLPPVAQDGEVWPPPPRLG